MEDDKQKKVAKKSQRISDLGENVRGALCYVLGFFSGFFFLFTEKENKFVRFHAIQSIIIFGIYFFISPIPVLGWTVSILLAPLLLLLWLFLMYKAYQGEKFKLPVIGDFAEKQAEKFGK